MRLRPLNCRIRAQLMVNGTAGLVHNHNNRLKLQRVAGFLFLLLLLCLPAAQRLQQTSSQSAAATVGAAATGSAHRLQLLLQIRHLRDCCVARQCDHLRLLVRRCSHNRTLQSIGPCGGQFILCHWHPFVQKLGTKQQCEGGAELFAHRAVEYEVDARVDQCQHVHEVT